MVINRGKISDELDGGMAKKKRGCEPSTRTKKKNHMTKQMTKKFNKFKHSRALEDSSQRACRLDLGVTDFRTLQV